MTIYINSLQRNSGKGRQGNKQEGHPFVESQNSRRLLSKNQDSQMQDIERIFLESLQCPFLTFNQVYTLSLTLKP
jgi:hypothetical protein